MIRAAALEQLIAGSKEDLLKQKLEQLRPFLAAGRSPSAVARHFGWDTGISGFIVPTTVMACYCFLRYPTNFDRAVQSSIGLGGDTDSVAAIVGGLVGAHVGYEKLPTRLVEQLNVPPHNAAWIAEMAERLSHWPHGVDDLHFRARPTLRSFAANNSKLVDAVSSNRASNSATSVRVGNAIKASACSAAALRFIRQSFVHRVLLLVVGSNSR